MGESLTLYNLKTSSKSDVKLSGPKLSESRFLFSVYISWANLLVPKLSGPRLSQNDKLSGCPVKVVWE